MTSLDRAVREWAIAVTPYPSNKPSVATRLSTMSTHELLVMYFQWRRRNVDARPRTVVASKAFAANPSAQSNPDVQRLLKKISDGDDLTPHLSKRTVSGPDDPEKEIAKRHDRDLLLFQWNVHHFHISHEPRDDGFNARTGPLLFVVFTDDSAFVVDLKEHGNWFSDDILRILATEWPDQGFMHEVQCAVGVAVNHTEADRSQLQRVAINVTTEIDGRVYMPVSFTSGTGTVLQDQRAADQWMIAIENFEKRVTTGAVKAKHGDRWPDDPEFVFWIDDQHGPIFVEKSQGIGFPLFAGT